MDLILLKPGNPNFVGDPLKFSDAEGALQDCYDGAIELISMHFAMKQQVSADVSNTARLSAQPIIGNISLVKYFDRSSILFYQACLTQKTIGSGDAVSRIFVLRNGHESDELDVLLTIELTNAMVSEIETQSHPNDMTTEMIKLNFTDIKWKYGSQNSDDFSQYYPSFSWSLIKNRFC